VPPALFDTHAHLDDDKLRDQLPAVLARATAAGVVQIVAIATTASSSAACVALAGRFPSLSASIGIHPNHAAEAAVDDWDKVGTLVVRPKVVAVGETGLDRHWDFTPFAVQEDYFARHLALARRYGKPVIIHCREAEADVLRLLRDDHERHGPIHGVMHSFAGAWATADACLAMGLHISFAGMVTYKNARDLRDVAAKVPLDRMLVETDSPYLSPVPLRGKINEPAHVVHTAACLAGVLGLDAAAFAELTTRNAQALFARR
jgi:TatD DNase family protein